jgi:hypothetical protein
MQAKSISLLSSLNVKFMNTPMATMRREKEKYRKYLTHNRSSMNQKQYKISFSTGGLFRREAMALAQLFLNLGDWQLVQHLFALP